MISVTLVLYVLALVSLFLAAISAPIPRLNMGWLGMFFWLLAVAIGVTK
jgi:hypothetical protein